MKNSSRINSANWGTDKRVGGITSIRNIEKYYHNINSLFSDVAKGRYGGNCPLPYFGMARKADAYYTK